MDPVGARARSTASAAVSAESMPPGEADHDVAEAVLADVVAQAELEREAHLLEVVASGARRPRMQGVALGRRGGESSHLGVGSTVPRSRASARAGGRRAAAARPRGRVEVDDEQLLLEARAPARRARPRRRGRPSSPSKISSSWPPTMLQSAMKHELSRARTRSISSRSRSLPTWNGEAEMFTMSCAPASARSVAGGPGCQMSSQIVGPTTTSPKRSSSRSPPEAK